jgi:competence protein ComEC
MRLIYAALGWCAGILIAGAAPPQPPAYWLIFSLMLALAAVVSRRRSRLRGFVLVLVMLGAGGLRFSLVAQSASITRYNGSSVTLKGVIVAEPDIRDTRVDLRVAVQNVTYRDQTLPAAGQVLVQAPRDVDVGYGDRIAAKGRLVTPFTADTFSYRDYLARSGVFSILQNAAVVLMAEGDDSSVYARLLALKDQARQYIAAALPDPAAALLTGILLGDSRGLAPVVSDAFSATGASHVIAISGFNMAILSGVVLRLLSRFRVPPRVAAVIGIVVIMAYTVLVGANAAVVRAAIMSSMLVIAGLIRRRTFVPTSLAFVTLLMSLQNPTVLWDVGFQLSLFATLGLALFVDPLSRGFQRFLVRLLPERRASVFGDILMEPFIVTLAAQIATLPLILLYFERLSLVSLAVNLLIIPAQPVLLILGMVATLSAFVSPLLAQMLYWLDFLLLSWTLGVVRSFAQLPFADVPVSVDPRLVAAFYLVLLGGAMVTVTRAAWPGRLAGLIRRRMVVSAVAFAGLGLATLMTVLAASRPDGRLHVWFLDLSHDANAVLIQTPGGAHILVDGGRYPSRLLTALGDRLPFNDRTLEMLVVTHPDPNDTEALPAVLERYSAGVVLMTAQPGEREEWTAVKQELLRFPVVEVSAGYSADLDDGTRIEVLHPQTPFQAGGSIKSQVMVLRVTFGDVSFLLTSDLNRSSQFALLNAGVLPLASVLQVPSHGAADSLAAEFVKAAQPQIAVIQSDPAGFTGKPDVETIRLLGDRPVYRTDLSGTLHLWTDGHRLTVVPERG